jgi:hypothetical protein
MAQLHLGFVKMTTQHQDGSQAQVQDEGNRFVANSASKAVHRLVGAVHRQQVPGIEETRLAVLGIESLRRFEFALCTAPVTVVEQVNEAERRVGIGQCAVQCDGAIRGVARQFVSDLGREISVANLQAVGVTQSGPRLGV